MNRFKLVNLINTKKDPRRKRRCKLTQSPVRLGRRLVAPGTSIKITEDQYKRHKKTIDAYLVNKVFEFMPINGAQKTTWEKLIAEPVPVKPEPKVVEKPKAAPPVVEVKVSEPVVKVIEEKIEVVAEISKPKPIVKPKFTPKPVAKKEEPKSTKKTYNRAKTGSGPSAKTGKKPTSRKPFKSEE